MKIYKNNQGFTLIELLLVVGIVAVILAVIVPMGLRARIDAKYGVVRQNCSELAGFASQWVEKAIQAQDEQQSIATIKDYYASLTGQADATAVDGDDGGQWVAEQADQTNWGIQGETSVSNPGQRIQITGRFMDGASPTAPEDTVEEIIPPDKVIRNPFTEVSVFRVPNDPSDPSNNGPVTGAIAIGGKAEGAGGGATNPWIYYAFAFQGTDSTEQDLTDPNGDTYHSGMGLDTIAKLRNGIFLGRFR